MAAHLGKDGRIVSSESHLGKHVPFAGVADYSDTKAAVMAYGRPE